MFEKSSQEYCISVYCEAFEKGRVVIRQGDIGFNFYFILSGSVFVEMQEEDQKTGKKHNMIIGELALFAMKTVYF